ncbi:hypothetical protein IAI18_22605 [Acetobacteraceae bacterium H6797]|nr:hypothetical protein [Acetobacteraceae bacterium H6797]
MAAVRQTKTNFTAGELAPEMLGRADIRSYANGARRLRNVFLQPTGGLCRRPGLRHVAMLPGAARLIPFEFNTEQTYLIVLTAGLLTVYLNDTAVASVAGPWTEAMLPQIAFTQNADTLLLMHPEMQPRKVTRSSHTAWNIAAWSFSSEPYYRFGDTTLTLTPSAVSGNITLTASGAVFSPGHVGTTFRLAAKPVKITAYHSAASVDATVGGEDLDDLDATDDWDEAAFSPVRGWPVSACFHQDRLVLGGSRDLPNRLWMSRSGDLFNFDLGTGLDDQGIEFGLLSDQVNAIRAVFSGRHLQVFTSGAEWMVTGDPLTPGNIQVLRQTRIGSPIDRMILPVDVDGSTIFIARSGKAVHEFSYADVSAVYETADLAMLAGHLIKTPQAMCYDQRQRLLHVVMGDGSLATLTLFGSEQITAWTAQTTDGAFRTITEVDGTVWLTVERNSSLRLERFDEALALDAALDGTAETAKSDWSGLGHLEGLNVSILADGAPVGDKTVVDGAIELEEPAGTVQIGLPFTHEIEPLPVELLGAAGSKAGPVRLVSVIFRVLNTAALSVDLGRGVVPVPFQRFESASFDAAPASYTGDITLRGLGWRRDTLKSLWRIEGSTPLPLVLLSVTTDVRMTD